MDDFKYKILLVEDIKIAQKVASLRLIELGCDVDIAETGKEGLELVNKKRYDLIFMDLGLDDMDGLTVIKLIRKMGKLNQRVPVIALTAHSTKEIRESCLQVGVDDFLVKPFTLESGRRIIEKHLVNRA